MNNHAEQFPQIAGGILLNLIVHGGASDGVAVISAIIAVMRLLHLIFYVGDMPSARSITFFVSGFCTIALYVLVFT